MKKYLPEKLNFILKFWPQFGILIATVISCHVFFRKSFHFANDIGFHLARMQSTAHAISGGQILPQLDPTTLNGFGYAANIFYGPLPTYFINAINFFVRNWALSLNIFIILATFSTGILTYLFINEISQKIIKNSRIPGFIAAICMVFGYSVAMENYAYVGFGPLFGISFVILLFWGIWRLFNSQKNFLAITLISVGAAGLPLCHMILTTITIPFAAIYLIALFVIFLKENKLSLRVFVKKIGQILLSGLLAFGLSAFFIFPLYIASKSGIYNFTDANFYNTFGWGSITNFKIEDWSTLYSFDINFIIFIAILIGITFLIINKFKQISTAILFTVFAGITILMQTPIFPWRWMPQIFLRIQYPSRFLIIGGIFMVFAIGILFAFFAKKFSRKNLSILSIITIIISFAIFLNVSHSQQKSFDEIMKNNPNISSYLSSQTNFSQKNDAIAIGEYIPKKVGICEKTYDQIVKSYQESHNPYGMADEIIKCVNIRGNQPKILSGEANILNFSQNSANISSSKESEIEFSKIYYSGYKARTGNKKELETKESRNGFLSVMIPANFHGEISIYFAMNLPTKIGVLITLISALVLIILNLFSRKKFLNALNLLKRKARIY